MRPKSSYLANGQNVYDITPITWKFFFIYFLFFYFLFFFKLRPKSRFKGYIP